MRAGAWAAGWLPDATGAAAALGLGGVSLSGATPSRHLAFAAVQAEHARDRDEYTSNSQVSEFCEHRAHEVLFRVLAELRTPNSETKKNS